MINAKPRFGLDVQAGVEVLFDYVTSRYIKVGEPVEDADGVWDSTKVAELIGAGKSIELAFTSNADRTPMIPGASDEVQQAASDFMNEPLDVSDGAVPEPASETVATGTDTAPESPAEAAAADASAIEPDPAPEDVKAD